MIHIKAKQQNVSFEKNVEKLAFVLSANLYNTLEADKVIEEAAKRSGISAGVIKAAWDAAGEVIRTWATEGHNVPLPGLGSMRFGVRSKSVQNIEDVKTSLISARRVVFIPSKEVKDELQNTKISITCYDKDGNIVKRVTSTDTNDVEDPEGGDDNGGGNGGSGNSENSGNGENTENSGSGSQNSGNSGNSGSQSQQNSVAAPTISGVNPFEETSQVSISGPDGATIYYSENGDDPDANDTLYTQPFTIDETTTIKAIAIKDGVSSQVTTKVFTKGTGGSGGFETGS
ncbi:MAG: chitobiase/beta-hexosaminidase C-terminal domain-containing protein [Prevotella sp.]|nr:chitobiase/beta-hexosaminidase C-terminal domain-containing protein [Prevotella sp.]